MSFRPTMVLADETPNSSYLNDERGLFRRGYGAMKNVIGGRPRRLFRRELTVEAPRPDFYDAVIRGFLWSVGFHYSPVQRDETIDLVMERMEDVEVDLGVRDAAEAKGPEALAELDRAIEAEEASREARAEAERQTGNESWRLKNRA